MFIVYICQTGCRPFQCITEHKRALKQVEFNSSALSEHAWSSCHPVDNVSVLVIPIVLYMSHSSLAPQHMPCRRVSACRVWYRLYMSHMPCHNVCLQNMVLYESCMRLLKCCCRIISTCVGICMSFYYVLNCVHLLSL